LGDAAPRYREAPEADVARSSAWSVVPDLIAEALPGVPAPILAQASDLIEMTLGSVGSAFSARPRTEDDIATTADAIADMFSAYLASLSD
jgi:hypothetical protein